MIIFYDKQTGKIVGNIEGRVHGEDHMKMWIGDKTKTERKVYNWKKTDKGWEPDIEDEEEKKMFISLDKRETRLKDHEIDVKTQKVKKKIIDLEKGVK